MRRSGTDDDRVSSLLWGVGLVLIGTIVLMQYLNVMPFTMWREWWPLILVLVGVGQILAKRTAKSFGDGISTILFGAWCFVATNHVYGLTWRNSWPLALVAAGMGMVMRALASWIMDRDEASRGVPGHPSGCLCDECCGEAKPRG